MVAYDKVFPQYDFAGNKGYGSAKHIEAIKKYGLSLVHRRSFGKKYSSIEGVMEWKNRKNR